VQGPLIADKARAEQEFRRRVAADPKLAGTYGGAWDAVAAAVAHERNIYVRNSLVERMPHWISPLLGHTVALNRYAAEIGKPDGQRLEEFAEANFPALRQQIVSPAPIHAELERTVLAWWLTKVREYLGTTDPDVRALLGTRSPEEIADTLVAGTKLDQAPLRAQLLEGGASAINAYHDPLIDFARTLDAPARAVRTDYENTVKAVITKNAALIAKARFALEGKGTYPDATFTLRLSYGAVAGYGENGRTVAPTTNFAGAYAHATGRDPFKLPDSWTKAEKAVDPNAQLNFVSTNDIIGGNSGSPVIGRNGEVIGLIFDGNIQSLGGDFGYDGSQNRAIAVDVTGITEALKHIYHADRLVKELTH
jgi:Peptidase S46